MFDQYDRVVGEQEQEMQQRIQNFKDGKRTKNNSDDADYDYDADIKRE